VSKRVNSLTEKLDPSVPDGFFDRLLEAARSQDPRRVAALCTEDVVFDDAGTERALIGREALMELLGSIYSVVTDLELEISERYVSLDGSKAGARWRATGTLREPAGRHVEFETAEFYDFRNGLISHWTFIARDPDWMGRQWGA
jgi:ketosteroid isomerase-like protein